VKIRFGYELLYCNAQVTPMVLLLAATPSPSQRLLVTDTLRTDPFVAFSRHRDGFGNQCVRLEAPAGTLRISASGLIEDPGTPDPAFWGARETPIADLPADTLMYTLPSRYCESDLLAAEALRLFSHLAPGWSRVQAICDFVRQYVDLDRASPRPTKTALETYNDGQGGSADMAHLAIAFCRAISIPARYATGYLAGSNQRAINASMDFTGCLEVFLDGAWHTFDPSNSARRMGRLIVARGRDAADVTISTGFEPATLQLYRVWADQVSDRHLFEAQIQKDNFVRQVIQAA
jgi:transglutaminase-like putative cysteine protease